MFLDSREKKIIRPSRRMRQGLSGGPGFVSPALAQQLNVASGGRYSNPFNIGGTNVSPGTGGAFPVQTISGTTAPAGIAPTTGGTVAAPSSSDNVNEYALAPSAPAIPSDLQTIMQNNPLPSGWYGPDQSGMGPSGWTINTSNATNVSDMTQAVTMFMDAYTRIPIQAVYPGGTILNYDSTGKPSTITYQGKQYPASAMGLGEEPMANKITIPAGSNVEANYDASGVLQTITWKGKKYPASSVSLGEIITNPRLKGKRMPSGLAGGLNWAEWLGIGVGTAAVGALALNVVAPNSALTGAIDSGAKTTLGGLEWAGGELIKAPAALFSSLFGSGTPTNNSAAVINAALAGGHLPGSAVQSGNQQAIGHANQGTLGLSSINAGAAQAGMFGMSTTTLILLFGGASVIGAVLLFSGKGKK